MVESDSDAAETSIGEEREQRSYASTGDSASSLSPAPAVGGGGDHPPKRHWRDVFWLALFLLHLIGFGLVLGMLGINRYGDSQSRRFGFDRFANITGAVVTAAGGGAEGDRTEVLWPMFGAAGGIGVALAWVWLSLIGHWAALIMRFTVHVLTTYLAVVSVLCFWGEHFFWGVAFAVGAAIHFLYVMSVMDRLPFTMLVLQKAVCMVWHIPEVMKVAYGFIFVMLCWMVLWSFGVAGVIALNMGDGASWWLLVVLSVSLFWTGAVVCNTVHVIVSGMVVLVLIQDGRSATLVPPKSLKTSVRYAVTMSFGSICYGSLFTAAIRTLRWEIRGLRSKIGSNECLLCCVDFLFHLVETLVRFFNKYAYVQIAVSGKGFNHSARDAWELFQSTGVEALVAYDCSGAVLLMGAILGGLITGTCTGVWAWCKKPENVVMVGSTAMLIGTILVGLAVVVVESAVTSIYVCYAEDPSLINRWDSVFFDQISEKLHQRLQYRSARSRQIMMSSRLDLNHGSPLPL